jgi:hypothetical protein
MICSGPIRNVQRIRMGTISAYHHLRQISKQCTLLWVLLFHLLLPWHVNAQSLHLQIDDPNEDFVELINDMQKLGFRSYILSTREFLEHKDLVQNAKNFSILIDYQVNYLSAHTLATQEDSLLDRYAAGMLEAKNNSSVQGHIVLRHPASTDSSFIREWERVEAILAQFDPTRFYLITSDHANDLLKRSKSRTFQNTQIISESHIFRSPFRVEDLVRFNELMTQDADSSKIIVAQSWLKEAIAEYSSIEESLIFWNTHQRFLLPLPAQNINNAPKNWLNMSIIVIIGLFILLYAQSQIYQQTSIRYFINYGFFADDVFRYSDRYTTTATSLFFLRAVIVSLSLVIWLVLHWSQADWEFFRLEVTPFGGRLPGPLTLSILLFISALVIQSVELLLLKIPKSGFLYTQQIFSIYSWNVHINALLLLILYVLFVNQSSVLDAQWVLYILAAGWMMGYVITALQGTKNQLRGNKRYLFWSLCLMFSFWAIFVVLFESQGIAQGYQSIFYHL